MKKAFASIVCLFLLLVSCHQQTLQQSQPIPQSASNVSSNGVVDEVVIAGNRRIPTETIKANIQTQAGVPFNEDTVKSDIERLRSLGYFDDVRITDDTGPTGGRHTRPGLPLPVKRVTAKLKGGCCPAWVTWTWSCCGLTRRTTSY